MRDNVNEEVDYSQYKVTEPLNKQALAKADEEFHILHPELKGKSLNPSQDNFKKLQSEWIRLYQKHGGAIVQKRKPSKKTAKPSPEDCFKGVRGYLEVYVLVNSLRGGGHGHAVLILQQRNKTYVRYSMAARNPNLQGRDRWEYFVWSQPSKVHIKGYPRGYNFKRLSTSDSRIIRIPTKHPEKIQEFVNEYIKQKPKYHIITNNCADFVNDAINSASDVDVSDATRPNDYLENLLEEFPSCELK